MGILLDEKLTFRIHVDYICKKLSKSLFCLLRAKSLLNDRALRTLYFAIFHSHLLYCANIIGCASKSDIKKISILQKKAIRLISGSNYNAHTKPILKKLNNLPFDDILYEQKMIFMYAVYNNYSPPSFTNTWIKNNTREQLYELRNVDNYSICCRNIDLKASKNFLCTLFLKPGMSPVTFDFMVILPLLKLC